MFVFSPKSQTCLPGLGPSQSTPVRCRLAAVRPGSAPIKNFPNTAKTLMRRCARSPVAGAKRTDPRPVNEKQAAAHICARVWRGPCRCPQGLWKRPRSAELISVKPTDRNTGSRSGIPRCGTIERRRHHEAYPVFPRHAHLAGRPGGRMRGRMRLHAFHVVGRMEISRNTTLHGSWPIWSRIGRPCFHHITRIMVQERWFAVIVVCVAGLRWRWPWLPCSGTDNARSANRCPI